MHWKTRSTGRKSIVVAALSAAALLFSQGTAFAVSGNWHFGSPPGTVQPGSKVSWSPHALCSAGPCSYSSSWHLSLEALSDAEFANSVGSSFAFVKGSTGARVGSCNVISSTGIVCRTSSSGFINSYDDLRPGGDILLFSSRTSCTATAEAVWWDTQGEPGRNSTNDDYQAVVTSGLCG